MARTTTNTATITQVDHAKTITQVDHAKTITGDFTLDVPWTPAEITTVAWYDANDATTITESGGAVSQWDDKSGNARHLTQATGSEQPITGTDFNGLNSITFDGSDDDMTSVTFPDPGDDLIAVGVVNATNPQPAPANCVYSLDYYFRFRSETDHRGGLRATSTSGSNSFTNFTGSGVNRTGQALWGVECTTSNIEIWHDGVEIANQSVTDGARGTPRIRLGERADTGGNNWQGDFGELVFVADVTVATRQAIEGYLAHKWGIESNLPVGHPYKDNAPIVGDL